MMNASSTKEKYGSAGIFSKAITGIKAFFGAFFGKDISHFPLAAKDSTTLLTENSTTPPYKNSTTLPTDVIKEINSELKLTFADIDSAKICLDEVKASYNEVKAATEYQDQKTARLLTILAFLTAATGALFSKVIDIYPLESTGRVQWQNILIAAVYILFSCYFLLVVVGALISFYAMQTRFVFKEETDIAGESKSLLFFKYIAITQPKLWAQEFNRPPLDLLVVYIQQYIKETYLIATKTSDKVRYIQPAQDILQLSIKVLVLWIIALIFTVSMVPRVPQQNSPVTPSVNGTTPQIGGANPAPQTPQPPNSEGAQSHDKGSTATMLLAPAAPTDTVAAGIKADKQGGRPKKTQ